MAVEEVDGEALRRAVIAAAGDARVCSMLETADVTAVAAVHWEASRGAVQGYGVVVALCVEELAAVDASPATRDALERSFAQAVAADDAHAMTSLATRWNGREVVRVTNYRDSAMRSAEVGLDAALRRYLAIVDGADAGAWRVEEHEGVCRASATPSPDRAGRQRVERALGSLLGPTVKVEW